MDIPPRGLRLATLPMLVSFDIDCGELVAGHHFVARGLSSIAIPHPDDLAAWDEANPRLDALANAGGFVSFTVPPGGFSADDTSLEATIWRRARSHQEAIEHARQVPGFDLEYELVPGLTEAEVDAAGDIFPFLVEVEYTADRDLPWEVSDGGAIAPAEGGASTPGSRGSWPIPDGARVLTFTLTGVDVQTGFNREDPDGQLIVDLSDQSARWVQTRPV